MPQSIFPPAAIYAIDITPHVDIRRDFTSQPRNNTNTADDVFEIQYFTDNHIANLSAILDNDLTELLGVPVCYDLNYEPFKYI